MQSLLGGNSQRRFATDGGSNICVVSGEIAAQCGDAATIVFGVKGAVLLSGFYAVSGISRVHARFELSFLRVKAVFDVGGAFAFEMEAGDWRVAVRGCMQNDFVRGVVQLNVSVIYGLATGTQGAAVAGYGFRASGRALAGGSDPSGR